MGGRYLVTGTQIGMLLAFLEVQQYGRAKKLLQEIEETQFVGAADEIEITKKTPLESLKEANKRNK